MSKSTATYWNTFAASNHSKWTPIKGMETMAEELTLSIDPERASTPDSRAFFPAQIPPHLAVNHIPIQKRFLLSADVYTMPRSICG
jgi:hypothetical protein